MVLLLFQDIGTCKVPIFDIIEETIKCSLEQAITLPGDNISNNLLKILLVNS